VARKLLLLTGIAGVVAFVVKEAPAVMRELKIISM
jgi:hypothetical protein